MSRFILSLLALVACATTSLVACNANMSLGSPSGSGGAPGAEGGAIGTGGLPALGGFGDASLPPADDATCNPGLEYQRTFPWQFQQQSFGGQGGGNADAGTPSGCQVTPSYDVSCSGPATLRADADGMGGAGGAAVVWDDGSKLIWSPIVAADPAIISPIPADGPDRRVWAEMKRYSSVGSDKMCSLVDVETMELRESEGGTILYMALQAPTLPELTADDLIPLFGVSADTVPSCSYETIEGCTTMRETLNDHVLQTTPPQTVPYGQPAQVTTPNGTFSVIWYSRSEQALGPVTACTCSGVAGQMVAFVASRTTAP